MHGRVLDVCDALAFLLDCIFIQFGTKLCGRVVRIPVGTGCAPLVADLFLFCCGRDFVMSLSDGRRADVVYPDIWTIFWA